MENDNEKAMPNADGGLSTSVEKAIVTELQKERDSLNKEIEIYRVDKFGDSAIARLSWEMVRLHTVQLKHLNNIIDILIKLIHREIKGINSNKFFNVLDTVRFVDGIYIRKITKTRPKLI